MVELEEIGGFTSPGEFRRFKGFLDSCIAKGELEEVEVDRSYHRGEIYGGTWFRLCQDESVWRLIEPDPPALGLFERVR